MDYDQRSWWTASIFPDYSNKQVADRDLLFLYFKLWDSALCKRLLLMLENRALQNNKNEHQFA